MVKTKEWLIDAIPMSAFLHKRNSRFIDIVNNIYDLMIEEIKSKRRKRLKSNLSSVLVNLFVAYKDDKPLMYSRNKNYYYGVGRYKKIFFDYNFVVRIFDKLEKKGYVKQYKGYHIRDENFKGKMTRVYAVGKLSSLFDEVVDEFIVERFIDGNVSVVLKDKDKIPIRYKLTRSVWRLRRNVIKYNDYIDNVDVKLDIHGDELITEKAMAEIKSKLLTGRYELSECVCVDKDDSIIINYSKEGNDKNGEVVVRDVFNKIKFITNTVRRFNKENKHVTLPRFNRFISFGIRKLSLIVSNKKVYRVFNNSSFLLGGRFYGSFQMSLNKNDRKFILLNNCRTIELDFSALHIRMLYHMLNLEYIDDPYDIEKDCPEKRDLYKAVQLVSINADNEYGAVMGIRNALRKINYEGVSLKSNNLAKLIQKFKQAHRPIDKYLCSGIGLRLQNLDSRITEGILMSLTRNGIPCLPVHDSYIVRDTDKEILYATMTEQYRNVMGFDPVIK